MRPPSRPRALTTEELVGRHRKLPRVDPEQLREEAEEFFGTEGRTDEDDARGRARG